MTTKAKPSKPAAKPKGAKGKPASGILGKLKNALAKKPAASAKSAPRKAAAKPAPRKPAPPARPAKAAVPAKKAAPVKASIPAKSSQPMKKAVSSATKSTFKGLMSEDQIRRMKDGDYMNDAQLEFFRQRLLQQRQEVLDRQTEVKDRLNQHESFADPADRATAEEEHWLDLRLRERESMLLRKIDEALRRIENREYGYCEKTGDAIGIPRLLARPTATVCVDVKGQDERVEAQFRDR